MRSAWSEWGTSMVSNTFHLHGHRWIVPGPDGNTLPAIQASAQDKAVSQFEDTRTFGPANSFTFKINQGSFMALSSRGSQRSAGTWRVAHALPRADTHDGRHDGFSLGDQGWGAFHWLPVGEPCPLIQAAVAWS